MDTTLASSITIFFFFFFFTFTSARVPFLVYIDHPNNPNSFSQNNPVYEPNSEPKAEMVKLKTEKPKQSSNRLPFTYFRFDPPNSKRPSSYSSRLGHSCQPRISRSVRRQSHAVPDKNFETVARGKVRHMARGWTRFGHVQPIFSRQRGMVGGRTQLLMKLHQRHRREQQIKDNSGLIKRIRKFLNHF